MSERPAARISSLKILIGALAIVPLRFRVFARALAVPFVLYLAFDSVWLIESAVDLYELFPWAMFTLTQLTELALYTIAAVTTHRIILLGPSSVPRYGIEWTRDTTRFFAWALVFTSVAYAIVWILSRGFITDRVPDESFLLASVPSVVICVLLFTLARLLLVFPAAAVGQPITLRHSWQLTRQRKLLMFLIVVVYPILIALPARLISDTSTAGYLLSSIVSLLALVVTVILLSFAYQQIQKERAGGG